MNSEELNNYIINRVQQSGLPNNESSLGKVPTVRALKVLNKEVFSDRIDVVLGFEEPISVNTPVNNYLIFVSTDKNNLNISPTTVDRSPAKISVPFGGNETLTLTFTVQTILKNGFISDLINSPTTSVAVTNGQSLDSKDGSAIVSRVDLTGGGSVNLEICNFTVPSNFWKKGSFYEITLNGNFIFNAGQTVGSGPQIFLTAEVPGQSPSFVGGSKIYPKAVGISAKTVNFNFNLKLNAYDEVGACAQSSIIIGDTADADFFNYASGDLPMSLDKPMILRARFTNNFTDNPGIGKIYFGTHKFNKLARF